ncbi:IS110 family transposase [Thiothrix winogradskyi]|uniref:IS110 family transposase n=1 Tax=Thiothrix winogradskyi TaxID=96472 RepID=A0ABY3T2A9_9GAMM|nr:IS110 family transposase [Thiothrix winogradskyi]UJS25956.1 IS110 family transposase [Thiothrix winogradskyi]
MTDTVVSIGIDVAKDKLQIAWLRQLQPLQVKPKSLPDHPKGYEELLDWLLKNTGVTVERLRITLEPTNIYHEGVALYLHDHGCQVCLVNAKQVSDFAASLGNLSKNDRKDSVMLARFGLVMNPRIWQPAPLEIRQLHALLDRLDTLQATMQQEENRLDTLQLRERYPKTVKESLDESIEFLKQSMQTIRDQIDDHIDRHPGLKHDQKLLATIPGVGALTAQRMIALIRSRDFTKASQVAAFMGLVPVERTSGTSVFKRPRISRRGDPELRGKLFMPVVAAITHNPIVQKFYRKLLDQKKHQRAAMTAAMRKLVHICFGVLKNQQVFSPTM